MNAMYSDHSTSFSEPARELMLATLDARLGGAAPADGRHPTLVIEIDRAGDASVGGKTVDDATLDELLQLSIADDPETGVVLECDRNAPHAAVVRIVDGVKASKTKRFTIKIH
jgi:biopolymer transport protein ExbD